jgi:transposase
MKETKFFEQALELAAPWKVLEVNMDVSAKKVEVKVDCGSAQMWLDPQSGKRLHVHGYEQRRWRHLPTMQFETIIVAQVPRLKYPDGHTELVKVPWADKQSQWTMLFERLAIDLLQACRSLSQACELLGLDWRSVHRIMERAVQRGLDARQLEGLRGVGLDEKSFGLGQDYVSVLSDLDQSRVLEVVPGNDKQSGCALWQSLPQAQRQNIEAAAMDMSAGFAAATTQEAPQVVIVHDKFHVAKMLNEAVDRVRRREHKELLKQNDQRLTGSRQLWLYNPINLKDERAEEFERLIQSELKTSRAWMLKESFAGFWQQKGRWHAAGYFSKWYSRAIRSRLEPVKKTAKCLKNHLGGLLNYFLHPITNAVTEGLNSRIQEIKANARGFRSFPNYRTRILFFCGKLTFFTA